MIAQVLTDVISSEEVVVLCLTYITFTTLIIVMCYIGILTSWIRGFNSMFVKIISNRKPIFKHSTTLQY